MTLLSNYDYIRPATSISWQSSSGSDDALKFKSRFSGKEQLNIGAVEPYSSENESCNGGRCRRSGGNVASRGGMMTMTQRPATTGGWSAMTMASHDGKDGTWDASQNFRSDFPNLPGFRKNMTLRPHSPKRQSLNFVNGIMMVNTPLPIRPATSPPLIRPATCPSREVTNPHDVSGRYSLVRRKADRETCGFVLPFCPESELPAFLRHDRRVLLFNAYYEENVFQSALEVRRVHTCEIYFYVEDGTIEIIQTKQENSGIPQGVFLRRSRVAKAGSGAAVVTPGTAGSGGAASSVDLAATEYYSIDDLKIGNVVTIYSRLFHIVNCNESTREYVTREHGWTAEEVAARPFPRDMFAEANREKMRRESGKPGVDRKRKMHELKEVMESMLGKQTSTTDRGMFLECGQSALCFDVVWDDRERLYGDIQFFKLFYYLADDTIEILPVHKKNNGRDQFPKLLKRSKLPKCHHIGSNNVTDHNCYRAGTPPPASEYYTWDDLRIGTTITVFGRSMVLARCDLFTRQHYASKGIQLKCDMALEPEEEPVVFERQIPPYNGFGSEEDSLRSCTRGINPPPPKKDLAKMRDKQGVIMRFNAHLLNDKTQDHKRRFVIQYFMEDDTIAIREPPIRNSGVMGGNFLRRQHLKKTDGTRYGAGDMYVGNKVFFMSHQFVLLNADDYTYRLMENEEVTFPFSSLTLVRKKLREKEVPLRHYFVSEYRGDGTVDVDELKKCCETIGLGLNEMQFITLWRRLDRRGKGRVSFKTIINLAAGENPMSAGVDD
eukprot:CAMPEP_0172517404 /NCGR_PEP_ID=MMETSP1066-20121228/284800_1 /TAXON_ID=671091 /ORGANISM="Coscinodiscus wailesii, Strain CCMP2513" /LENGTH=775 /DNA_ID=CAMNT_0013299393 /DNA_START=71 /DNA_END=2398 /DNA_ORIENTATION=+